MMADIGREAGEFVDKWLAAEPWHRLLLVFEPPSARLLRQLTESIGYELRRTAFDSSDERVAMAKLGWWAEEWRHAAAGQPRHPLTGALARHAGANAVDADAGMHWAAATLSLAQTAADADLAARIARWHHYADAQAMALRPLFGTETSISSLHVLALIAERLRAAPHEPARGRLPVTLADLAALGLTRSALSDDAAGAALALARHAAAVADALDAALSRHGRGGYRYAQAAVARLLARRAVYRPEAAWRGELRPPPLRALLAAWRARRP